MKVKTLLMLLSRHKITVTAFGIIIISVTTSLIFVHVVYGQNSLRQIIDTIQQPSLLVTTESASVLQTSADIGAAIEKNECTVLAVTRAATVAPSPSPSPAEETTVETTPAATIETTQAAATETAPAATTAAGTAATAKTTSKPASTQPAKPTAAVTTAATAAPTTAATAAATTAASCSGTYDSLMAKAVLDLVNQQRTAAGLPALVWSDSLASTAKTRAQEISISFSHTRPVTDAKGNAMDCFTAFPSEFCSVAENIAKGQSCSADVMAGWMGSENHKNNILRSSVSQLGVACYNVNGTYYWVQDFGG